VAYQYFFAPNLSGEVTQYSLPDFTNYTYSWKVASSLVSAHAKLNGPIYHRFSPYVSGGLGVVYSKSQYSETALGDVTPRISPNYGSIGAQFAYVLGAGIDYALRPQQLILSAGYQYSNLGTFNSGYGTGRWLNERLNLGANQSNAFILGLTYFI
jgi:opacity protein-like surface antigen